MDMVKGQYALVTGGGTGIGFGVAQRLLEQGAASVLIVGRREEVLVNAVQRLKEMVPGAEVSYQTCDITNEQDVADAVAAAADNDGQLDIMVSNAGSGSSPAPLLSASVEDWRFCTELNIVASAMCIKHAGRAMRKKGGSIITISSTAGTFNDLCMAPYGSTKAGLEHLSKCAARELGRFNIRVNSVAPGYVPTEGMGDAIPQGIRDGCVERTPLERPGKPQDIGDAVVYLSSAMANWVTGQVIGVDGGLNMHPGTDWSELAQFIVGEESMEQAGFRK